MPYRLSALGWVLIGMLGLLVVAALALMGRDVRRESRTGARWKRRMVAAGRASGAIRRVGED